METTTTTPEINRVQPSPLNLSIKGGVITGIILAVLTIVFIYILGNLGSFSLQLIIGVVSSVIGIILTQRAFKQEGDGYMSYGKGLVISMIMMGVAGLVLGIINISYINFVDPTIPGQIVDATIESTYEMTERFGGDIDAVEAQFDGKREEMIADQKSFINVLWATLIYVVFGLILGLIITAFTKEAPPEAEY